jgi:hypothetical protein
VAVRQYARRVVRIQLCGAATFDFLVMALENGRVRVHIKHILIFLEWTGFKRLERNDDRGY